MTGVVLFGYGGMGKVIESIIKERDDMEICRIIDFGEVIFENGKEYDRLVGIDFSHFKMADDNLAYVKENRIPLICGTTGLSEEQLNNLKEAGKVIPVCYSSNYSYGVLAMKKILAYAMNYLADWDIELVEAHHNKKADAPSGTAKTLLEIIGDGKKVYGREGESLRTEGEIGVHAIRGGTENGMHEVIFFGDNEQVSIKHHAQTRRIFANGAVIAANRIPDEPGYYTFEDIVG